MVRARVLAPVLVLMFVRAMMMMMLVLALLLVVERRGGRGALVFVLVSRR
jgi:hypothetical protein